MTMNQQHKTALTQNWDQAKTQLQAQYPQCTEEELNQGRSNPDQLIQAIAQKTGQDPSQVEQAFSQVAQQFSQK